MQKLNYYLYRRIQQLTVMKLMGDSGDLQQICRLLIILETDDDGVLPSTDVV